jgi:hypothetical protein
MRFVLDSFHAPCCAEEEVRRRRRGAQGGRMRHAPEQLLRLLLHDAAPPEVRASRASLLLVQQHVAKACLSACLSA